MVRELGSEYKGNGALEQTLLKFSDTTRLLGGSTSFIMYTISNIYVLAGFGTIGGALFGFDISSMSAWIDQKQYLEFFNYPNSNLQGGVSLYIHTIRRQLCVNNNTDYCFHVSWIFLGRPCSRSYL
jgi:hypothetical protein